MNKSDLERIAWKWIERTWLHLNVFTSSLLFNRFNVNWFNSWMLNVVIWVGHRFSVISISTVVASSPFMIDELSSSLLNRAQIEKWIERKRIEKDIHEDRSAFIYILKVKRARGQRKNDMINLAKQEINVQCVVIWIQFTSGCLSFWQIGNHSIHCLLLDNLHKCSPIWSSRVFQAFLWPVTNSLQFLKCALVDVPPEFRLRHASHEFQNWRDARMFFQGLW